MRFFPWLSKSIYYFSPIAFPETQITSLYSSLVLTWILSKDQCCQVCFLCNLFVLEYSEDKEVPSSAGFSLPYRKKLCVRLSMLKDREACMKSLGSTLLCLKKNPNKHILQTYAL